MRMTLKSFVHPRQLTILINDQVVFTGEIGTDRQTIAFPARLDREWNTVRIFSPEKSIAPREIPKLQSHSRRLFSFQVSSIDLR
jgi:hypothetical protein